MDKDITFVLLHSPLVGPFSWELVQQMLKEWGLAAPVPALLDDPNSTLPYWQQHAESVVKDIAEIPTQQKIILVAHSGAGPLLPAIRQKLTHPVFAYVFVDAGIPRDGLSRLELMKLEDAEWAEQFHQALLRGENFPTWSEEDLREILPDAEVRRKLVDEIRPRPLPFFAEPIPVQAGWPDAPCVYIKFSTSYEWDATQAKREGWLVYEIEAGHFHMLVDPMAVADLLVTTVQNLLDSAQVK
jgi:alpha/beta hydrolase family protein